MDEFITNALRTESTVEPVLNPQMGRLLHASIGIATESGELLDAIKKHLYYGKVLDLTNVKEELGDLLWYIALAMDVVETDFQTEMDRVIRKLRVRFPDKFNVVEAACRDLDAERAALEQSPFNCHHGVPTNLICGACEEERG